VELRCERARARRLESQGQHLVDRAREVEAHDVPDVRRHVIKIAAVPVGEAKRERRSGLGGYVTFREKGPS
jgi:hypothetical protein